MCLILFAYKMHADYNLILAANRDEFYSRPASPLAYWEDNPEILAGRDLQAKGTWLGVSRRGRFAAITNFRDPSDSKTNAPSRGDLVTRFLTSSENPKRFLQSVEPEGRYYNGFNLLVGSADDVWYFSNRGVGAQQLEPGIYGLSNHLLDTPWPKIARGKKAFVSIVTQERLDQEAIFTLLGDRTVPPTQALPDTGVGLEWEKLLSPLFIESSIYGTRCSSLLTMGSKDGVRMVERTFGPPARNDAGDIREFNFKVSKNRNESRETTLKEL